MSKPTHAPLAFDLAGISLKNPVFVASGTFGYGEEFKDLIDLNQLGGIMTKGTTLKPRAGNPQPRLAETSSGLINSIGLQNDGVEAVKSRLLPFLAQFDTAILVNVSAGSIEEYCQVVTALQDTTISGIELNISCPNVAHGMDFGRNAKEAANLVAHVKKVCRLPLIVKLSPNVTNIREMATAVVESGADALSLINTVLGIGFLSSGTASHHGGDINPNALLGGFSGPAVKPIALRMVYEVAQVVDVPIIGMGGIVTWEDALEFILCGAHAVAVGTGNFLAPDTSIKVIKGLQNYCERKQLHHLHDLRGKVNLHGGAKTAHP